MNEIRKKLELLESILKETNAPLLELFNPGLEENEIVRFFSNHDIPTHPDLLSLYRWHNGLVSIYGRCNEIVNFSPLGAFPNLTEMASLRNNFMSYDYFEVDNRHEYIPFLSNGEDDMHLLRISTGEVYHSSPGIQIYCEPQFHSISSMLDFIVRCFNEKLLSMDPIEGLLVDEKYWEIETYYGTT